MGCCLSGENERDAAHRSTDETSSLLNNVPQKEFRCERRKDDFGKHKILKKMLQCLCASLGLYRPSGWGLVLSFILTSICVFQLVYDLFVVFGCPGFDCGFLAKKLEKVEVQMNTSEHGSTFRKTSNTVYTMASIGGLFSYTSLLLSLILIVNRRRKYDYKAVGPSDTLHEDLTNNQVKILISSQVILMFFFVSSVVLFYYLIRDQPRDGWYYYMMVTGVAAQFVAQWAAIVGCHIFLISSFALGTLANDTIQRIRQITGHQSKSSASKTSYQAISKKSPSDTDHEKQAENGEIIETVDPQSLHSQICEKHTNSFDIALGYHEELCSIVSDTVSAYCPWFVLHWLLYGVTCLIGVIYVSEEFTYSKNPVKLAYVNVFLGTHLYMFLLPCCCAAYITDTCGGIYSRINKTTSNYWKEGHPFRDRAQLTMFTSYAKDRQCVFKIGRLTFTSTLAWISLLLGSTGLLFHFF